MILGRAYNTWTSCLTLGTLPGLLQNGKHRYDSGNKDWSFYFLKPDLEEWTLLSPISSISPHKEAHVSLFHPLTMREHYKSLSLLVKSMYHHIIVLTKFHWNSLFGSWETIWKPASQEPARRPYQRGRHCTSQRLCSWEVFPHVGRSHFLLRNPLVSIFMGLLQNGWFTQFTLENPLLKWMI